MEDERPKTAADHQLAFELAEASSRLEGIDPMSSPLYVALRTRVIAGEITSDEAGDLLVAHYEEEWKAHSGS